MSSADRAQNWHMVPRALRLRLKRAFMADASWHDWHQLGVLLGELAESARMIGRPGWREYHQAVLSDAVECLDIAMQLLPTNSLLERCAVRCDSAIVVARLALHSEPEVARKMTAAAVTRLHEVTEVIARQFLMRQPSDNPAAWHQMAIARSCLARILHGRDELGFVEVVPETECQPYAQWIDAISRFGQELACTPDSASAHRALLLSLVTIDLRRNVSGARRGALSVLLLAVWHHDVMHVVRAVGLLIVGARSERLLRQMRDGRMLRQPVPSLPFIR